MGGARQVDNPMARLVIYKDFFKHGLGAERATATMANAMVALGYDVHIITKQPTKNPFSVTFSPEVTCHRLPHRRHPLIRTFNKWILTSALGERLLMRCFPKLDLALACSKRLQAMLRQLTPDLIIAAGSGESIDLLLAGPLEVPVVAMFHIFPPACFAQNKLRRATRLKVLLPQVAECQVLLPSHRDTLRPYTAAPVTAIANGITYPVDEPLPPAASREKTILYVANFLPEKNHAELMDAFSRLNAPEWTLHLYGSGKPEAEATLKALAQDLGIADRVRFKPPAVISRPVLLQASICAFPSKMEGFGLALAEAMWCGLPCVGFKAALGVNELIVHEANGLLADPGPEAFAAQLQRLIDDAALREHLGAIAARTARRAWAQETIMQLWDDLIQRNLQRPRPTPTSPAEPNA